MATLKKETLGTLEEKNTPLTKRILTVLNLAHQEARMSGQQQIDTEHLLLGLLREQQGMGAEMLHSMGVHEEQVRREIHLPVVTMEQSKPLKVQTFFTRMRCRILRTPARDGRDVLRLSTQAKQCLALAGEEAQRLQVSFLGTEHLLFGLASVDESVAGKTLNSLQVDADKVHEYIMRAYRRVGVS